MWHVGHAARGTYAGMRSECAGDGKDAGGMGKTQCCAAPEPRLERACPASEAVCGGMQQPLSPQGIPSSAPAPHLDEHGARDEAPQRAQRIAPLAVAAAAAARRIVIAREQIEQQLDCGRGGRFGRLLAKANSNGGSRNCGGTPSRQAGITMASARA